MLSVLYPILIFLVILYAITAAVIIFTLKLFLSQVIIHTLHRRDHPDEQKGWGTPETWN